jgi:D-arginine dehydrogenase
MLAFTRASHKFFADPPPGFAEAPLMERRDTLFFEAAGQEEATAKLLSVSSGLEELSEAEARKIYPLLRPNYAKRIFRDAATADLDVDLLHRGYLRMMKQQGAALLTSAPVKAVERRNGEWRITAGDETFSAPVIVNAAGAWGDGIAELAGVTPIGLEPRRRSIGVVPVDPAIDVMRLPLVTDMGETWYAKPQSGKLLVSSADATPVDPHDAYADDMAIAEGIERLQQAADIEVTRLDHSWGGLRTFARDGAPVIGFDPHTEGFFWLVGQGGYGIQSAPALSRYAAALASGEKPPADIIAGGLDPADVSPARFS